MFAFHRKALSGIGVTAAAVASTALFAAPAEAASAGAAKVVGSSTVQFNALTGKTNGLVITISGRTITLDDKVAIKAGKGCKAVRHDKTKVKCTTKKKVKQLRVALGDKNDTVTNKTSVPMLADGGAGNDILNGGSGKDQLQGGAGNDRLYGKAGNDILIGGNGNDLLSGAAGDDKADAGWGDDAVYGDAGNDTLFGWFGNDRIVGGTGNDEIDAGAGNDTVFGEAGNDEILGDTGDDRIVGQAGDDKIDAEAGNDTVFGEAGVDVIVGDTGNDVIAGGAGNDILVGLAGDDRIFGEADDDFLVGEDLADSNDVVPVGSDSALDLLDGGTQVRMDFCYGMAAATKVDCEFPADSFQSRAHASAPAAAAVKAIEQAKGMRAGQGWSALQVPVATAVE